MKKIRMSWLRWWMLLLVWGLILITPTFAAEAIKIYTIEDLYGVNYDLAGNYILMNDIDLSLATAVGGDYDYMGNGWEPIGSGGK